MTLAASLLVPGTASAIPRIETPAGVPGAPTLPSRPLVDLGAGARNVKVQESPGGGTVAVVWQNAAANQVWARVRTNGVWRKKVRLSPAAATATGPSMDLDSDGSLLVGWTEKKKRKIRVVARRLKGAVPGPRRVFNVRPTQAPQVGAGQFHDVIAWTARVGGVNRPFVSVDAGAGFKKPTRITMAHETFPGTLRVNSDGPQAHLAHLTKDTKKRIARSSWAVLDPQRTKNWRTLSNIGPRQRYDTQAPEAPLITFHEGTRVVLALTNEQIAEEIDLPESPGQIPAVRQRWSAGVTWVSHPNPARGFGRWVELHNPPAVHTVDRVTHLRNIRGSVVAAHSGDQGLVSVLLRPGNKSFDLHSTSILSSCRPFPEWFLPALPSTRTEPPALHCVDNEADSSAQVLTDLYDNPIRRLAPQTRGTVRARVPDPLVAALTVTEDLPGTNDPLWLHDVTPGGRDTALPRRTFTRTKAGRVKGKARVGRTLTAVPGTWRPGAAKVRYKWFVGKKRLKKQTARTLKVRKKMRGKKVRVKVTLIRDGYRNRTVTMRAKGKVR